MDRKTILRNVFPFHEAAWEGRWVLFKTALFFAAFCLLAYAQSRGRA